MKKIFSILLLLALLIQSAGVVFAEGVLKFSDTTKINVENTDTVFAKPTSDEYHTDSNYYMHFKTGGDWLEVNQSLTETAIAGSQYDITVVAKPISAQLWLRVGWDDDDGAWMMINPQSEGTDLGDGWKEYKKTVTMKYNQNGLIIHSDGATEFYIDSISLKPAGGSKELMSNGGFDGVSYDSSADTITAQSTTVNVTNTDTLFAKILREAKTPANTYSLHFKTSGDWLEVSQDFTASLEAGQYIMTAYTKCVSGTIWFRVYNDPDGAWMATHAQAEAQPDGWTKHQRTVTVNGANNTKLFFHNDGPSEFYVDDISFVKVGETENLMPDGGFGDVTIDNDDTSDGDTDDDNDDTANVDDRYTYEINLNETTISGANGDTCRAEGSNEQFRGDDGFSLYFKTPGGEGENIEVSQNLKETVTAGDQYVFTAYIKNASGRLWFRIGWDDTGWMVSDQEGEVQPDGWTKIQKTITMTGDQTTILLINEGTVELYVDDISLIKVGETENLVPNGGFDVTITCPDYEVLAPVLKKGTQTVDAISGAGTYTVEVSAKNNKVSDGVCVELLVAVFDSTNEMVNLYSDSEVIQISAFGEPDTDISETFDVAEGYTAEVYVINNRQDIDVYYDPVSY